MRRGLVLGAVGLWTVLATVRAATPPLPDDPACTAADRHYIARTYELARESTAKGDGGHGALLVKDGRVILEFASATLSTHDLTKHAETGLLSLASRTYGMEIFKGATLYTSEEPCLMCCGTIRNAGIARMVYGVTALQAQRVNGRKLPVHPLQCREIFDRTGSSMVINGPLAEGDGLEVTAEHARRQQASAK